jgi:hypothetical protein
MGECARRAGNAEQAKDFYQRYLRDDPSGSQAITAKERLAELDRASNPPPPVTPPPQRTPEVVTTPPAPVAPPPAVNLTPPPSAAPKRAPESVVAQTRPSFASTTRGRATITLGVLSGAMLLTGAILGGLAVSTHSDYERSCNTTCDHSIYTRGHSLAIATDVLLSVGAASTVTTLLVAFVPSSHHNYALAPQLSPTSAGLGFSGSF